MAFKNITPNELHELIQAGRPVDLIDVRTPAEYRSVHAVGARSMPLGSLSREAVTAGRTAPADEPIYVICKSGVRSRSACAQLAGEGLNVVNVEGGTMAWQRAGLPVEGAPGGGSSAWIRLGGLLAVGLCLVLGMTVSSNFWLVACGIWVVLVVTGNGPCCAGGACALPRKSQGT